MKKICTIFTGILSIFLSTQITYAQTNTSKKILIVYYSRSGNTAQIANYIKKTTSGDIFEIKTVTPYPEDYKATTEQAKKEIRERYKPKIQDNIKDIAKYDIIFIGSPSWWSTIAPPVSTFLAEHDLSGKIIIPFVTHEGPGLGNNVEDIKKILSKSKVLDGKAFRGSSVSSSEQEVKEWIKQILTSL